MAKSNVKTPTKRQITQLIALTGIKPNYTLRTSGFAGIPYDIDVTDAGTGFAIQRALRERAADRPDLFPEGWENARVPA